MFPNQFWKLAKKTKDWTRSKLSGERGGTLQRWWLQVICRVSRDEIDPPQITTTIHSNGMPKCNLASYLYCCNNCINMISASARTISTAGQWHSLSSNCLNNHLQDMFTSHRWMDSAHEFWTDGLCSRVIDRWTVFTSHGLCSRVMRRWTLLTSYEKMDCTNKLLEDGLYSSYGKIDCTHKLWEDELYTKAMGR